MRGTGLAVFDKTLQTTIIWLDEIMAKRGLDRQMAWHVLGAVLHAALWPTGTEGRRFEPAA